MSTEFLEVMHSRLNARQQNLALLLKKKPRFDYNYTMLSRVPCTLEKEGNDRNDMETLQLESTNSTTRRYRFYKYLTAAKRRGSGEK